MAFLKLARLLILLTALTPLAVEAQESAGLGDSLPQPPAAADAARIPSPPPPPDLAAPPARPAVRTLSSGASEGLSIPEAPTATLPQADAAALAPPLARLEIRDTLGSIRTVDLTTEPDDIWQRMRNGFAMPDLVNDLVTSHQMWFLNRPEYLRRTFDRARRYMHFIVEELEKRGMPTELALLPMVESSYNPMAISPARASGMWQFIPSTGKSFGLKQDWWADERRDIVASTNAALEYLQTIYTMQGDWHLALASYNWGEGAVARSMARTRATGKPVTYMSINMPAETRNYVPRLQALKNIISDPKLFGAILPDIPNRPYFTAIKRPADMDVTMAAKLAEMPMEEFRALNPGHNRPVLRAGGSASLVLPADKVKTFLVNLENTDKPLVSWKNHTLGKKETLAQVAAKFGITLAQLRNINGLNGRTKLKPGQTLLVPARNGEGKIDEAGADLHPPPEALTPNPKSKSKATKTSTQAAKAGKTAKAGKSRAAGSGKAVKSKSLKAKAKSGKRSGKKKAKK